MQHERGPRKPKLKIPGSPRPYSPNILNLNTNLNTLNKPSAPTPFSPENLPPPPPQPPVGTIKFPAVPAIAFDTPVDLRMYPKKEETEPKLDNMLSGFLYR